MSGRVDSSQGVQQETSAVPGAARSAGSVDSSFAALFTSGKDPDGGAMTYKVVVGQNNDP
jgi:hypothetical protein